LGWWSLCPRTARAAPINTERAQGRRIFWSASFGSLFSLQLCVRATGPTLDIQFSRD
jgi:hypothetical protein